MISSLYLYEYNEKIIRMKKEMRIENMLAQKGYISGITGTILIIISGIITGYHDIMVNGYIIGSFNIVDNPKHVVFSVLFLCAITMFSTEIIVRWKNDKTMISVSPLITGGRLYFFIVESITYYALYVVILYIAIIFFKNANEYGFGHYHSYYSSWLSLMDIIFNTYLRWGLIYVVITRALQHDPLADRKEPVYLLFKLIFLVVIKLGLFKKKIKKAGINITSSKWDFTQDDKNTTLGVIVKLFFCTTDDCIFCRSVSDLCKKLCICDA